jgi:hypothetical protein
MFQAVDGVNVAGLGHDAILDVVNKAEGDVELLLLMKDFASLCSLYRFIRNCQ